MSWSRYVPASCRRSARAPDRGRRRERRRAARGHGLELRGVNRGAGLGDGGAWAGHDVARDVRPFRCAVRHPQLAAVHAVVGGEPDLVTARPEIRDSRGERSGVDVRQPHRSGRCAVAPPQLVPGDAVGGHEDEVAVQDDRPDQRGRHEFGSDIHAVALAAAASPAQAPGRGCRPGRKTGLRPPSCRPGSDDVSVPVTSRVPGAEPSLIQSDVESVAYRTRSPRGQGLCGLTSRSSTGRRSAAGLPQPVP